MSKIELSAETKRQVLAAASKEELQEALYETDNESHVLSHSLVERKEHGTRGIRLHRIYDHLHIGTCVEHSPESEAVLMYIEDVETLIAELKRHLAAQREYRRS